MTELNAGRIPQLNGRTLQIAQRFGTQVVATSDSHTGQVGKAWTEAPGDTPEEFLRNIRRGAGRAVPHDASFLEFMREVLETIDLVFVKQNAFTPKRTFLKQLPVARKIACGVLGNETLMGPRPLKRGVQHGLALLALTPAYAFILQQRRCTGGWRTRSSLAPSAVRPVSRNRQSSRRRRSMRAAKQPARMKLIFHPATPDRWTDFETLFGKNGACAGCWCMWWRRTRSEWTQGKGAGNRTAIRGLIRRGEEPGVLAYDGDRAVGWCAVAPREAYPGLARSRVLKPVDAEPVWSVTCFFVDREYRKKGVSTALLRAAADFVRARGGRIVEGYPVAARSEMPAAWAWTGLATAFVEAGYTEVARRSPSRPIYRRVLPAGRARAGVAKAAMRPGVVKAATRPRIAKAATRPLTERPQGRGPRHDRSVEAGWPHRLVRPERGGRRSPERLLRGGRGLEARAGRHAGLRRLQHDAAGDR